MTLLFSMLLACGTTPVTLTPESAGSLADALVASPGTAETILAEAGTDAATFEAYLFTIAEDAELTRRYLSARH
jgi:hypothetical protein